MNFFGQRTVCYLIDQINYLLLIMDIKTPARLKRQLFDNSDSKERTPRVYKCSWIDESDNEEQDLDNYEGKVNGYVLFPLLLLLLLPQKSQTAC